MKFTLKEWNKIWEMLERDKSKMSVRVAEYDRKIKEYHIFKNCFDGEKNTQMSWRL